MSAGDVFRIPQFLQARTKEDLVRAMLMNNLAHGIEFDYFGLQKDGKDWVVWFRLTVDRKAFVLEAMNGDS